MTYGITGENVRIPCKVEGQDIDFIFTWYQDLTVIYARLKDGTVEASEPFRNETRFHMENQDWSTLVIEKSQKKDYGHVYECKVRDKDASKAGITKLEAAGKLCISGLGFFP